MKISGAIFDLDGTLTDSMAIWEEAPCALVRLYGKTPPENLAQALTQMSREEAARYLIQTFDLPAQPQQILVDINDLVTGYYRDTAPLKPGAAMLIERLAKAQIPMCIATASEVFQARDAMERLGQWRYFQFALSCMRFGGKTDPNIYLQAANRLGAAPGRIVVFEDALHAAHTAKQAGFLVAGVFDRHEKQQAALKALCDWYLLDLSDFAPVLDAQARRG